MNENMTRFLLTLILSLAFSIRVSAQQPDPFQHVASKKGLQVELVDDAIALGIKHAAINVDLCSLVDIDNRPDSLFRMHEGKRYSFLKERVESLDARIRALSDKGVLVYVILLVYQSARDDVNNLMIHPKCMPNAPNRLGAFNTSDQDGCNALQATIEFLAERWSQTRPKLWACSWVYRWQRSELPLVVVQHGRVSIDDFVSQYESAVRIVHAAVRKYLSTSRVYVSLEHHWTIRFPAGTISNVFQPKSS